MSLLAEIRDAAVDENSDLGTLLRKCKVLASRLGSSPLEDWLIWEANGYPEDVEVPDYRKFPVQVRGTFFGPFGSSLQNIPIPFAVLPEKARPYYEEYSCRESISAIQRLVKKKHSDDGASLRLPTGDMHLLLGNNVYRGYSCAESWGEVSEGNFIEILNSVRNRILDFILAIEKQEPEAGESVSSPEKRIEPDKVTQTFYTTVYGGSANIVGTATHSKVTFSITPNDFASLEQFLRQNEVSDEDIAELQQALVEEPPPTDQKKFGPRISAWLGKMVAKAAEGSWNTSIAAAGNLLAQAIMKYYGLP